VSNTAIKVENLSKKYIIQHEKKSGSYETFSDALINGSKKLAKKIIHPFSGKEIDSQTQEEFWALKDINFEINQGDKVGIIGRNGAGKSTLLKILSRITEPTSGKIHINGRIASLLEVGTGFHPELTGRENIYLNGAILGMSRREIKNKFDEIVAFSEVEKFLDTPVKRYSSGMYVRLAFAVAAYLESEILVVDEVLAVGDAEFQKKCLGKMDELSKGGRTILFVSHNLGAIKKLCNKGIVLKEGRVFYHGEIENAIEKYTDNSSSINIQVMKNKGDLSNKNQFVAIYNADNSYNNKTEFMHNEEINIVMELFLPAWKETLEISMSPYDKDLRRIFTMDIPLKEYYHGDPFFRIAVKIPGEFLTVGNYSWIMCINDPQIENYDLQDEVCSFSILETGSQFSKYHSQNYGYVYPPKYSVKHLKE